jgi:hypothetical protein
VCAGTPYLSHHYMEQPLSIFDGFFEWHFFTKEGIGEQEVLVGLLDHGLFAEKVPPCFSSKGLAEFVIDTIPTLLDEPDENTLKNVLGKRSHDYIRYEALRDLNVPRHLGIPHPEGYGIQALAISKHWKEISVHCNKPDPQVSRIYVRHIGDGVIFEMSYKGSEKYENEENEIEWMTGSQFQVAADIAKCFPSIYTHSIPWALHGKGVAKKSSSITAHAGNMLDKCTQNIRDKQTNGLLIGPHSSNIISEIILTSIDAELVAKGHTKLKRHVDDYTFYATTYEQAEQFLRDLRMALRSYEMFLNEKKTEILPLPRPSSENWVRELNCFVFPAGDELRYAEIRRFLDLALHLSLKAGKSTPLNYAMKMIAGTEVPRKLNDRAKRLYVQEAMSLAFAYPYLVPVLDSVVFDRYAFEGMATKIGAFATSLVRMGLNKLHPDTIAHAIFYALKHVQKLELENAELLSVVAIDDCVTNVLLYEYATIHGIAPVSVAIKARAHLLKGADQRDRDKQWLLIYQQWSAVELDNNGQKFLGALKATGMSFFHLPILPHAFAEVEETT